MEVMRFDGFELQPHARRLQRGDQALPIGTRAFDVLLALVKRRGQVVPREELLETVWQGRVVEDGNLAVQVNTLRKLLGEAAIATVQGRGYQWTLPTQVLRHDAGSAGGRGLAPAPAPVLAEADGAAAPAHPAAQAPRLIGRAPELSALHQALADGCWLQTVVGPAGTGKTALVRVLIDEVAARRVASTATGAPDNAAAGDGPCLVELATLQADARLDAPLLSPGTVHALLAAWGGVAATAGDPQAQLTRRLDYAQRHGQLPALLVLDNAEHVQASVRSLVTLVHRLAPRLPIVVTSQQPLGLAGERLLRLAPLALPAGDGPDQVRASPAAALLVRRVRAVDPQFGIGQANAAAVADICRRLDGLPLALELAAARVPLLGADGVRARLSERWRLLRQPGQAADPRHQTLHTALDWSYELLPPFEQRLLHRLTAFASSFSTAQAQALCADAQHDEWAVLDALNALIGKSLVVPDPVDAPGAAAPAPRFRLLESVRDYARSHPAAEVEAAWLARRHAEMFVALAESVPQGQLGGDQVIAGLGRIGLVAADLQAAMRWCIAHDTAAGLRLAAALYVYWRSHGHLAEGRAACSALLTRAAADPPGATRVAVMVCLGALAMEQDDASTLQTMGEQVLRDAQVLGDTRRQAHGHGLLAHAALIRNQPAAARRHFGRCLALFRARREPVKVAETLSNLAGCWESEGQIDKGLRLLDQALPLVQGLERWTEAAVRQSLGDLHLAQGDVDIAAPHLLAALALRRETLHVQQVLMSAQSVALLELQRGRPGEARPLLVEAVRACDRHGYGQLDALSLAATGAWALMTGHDEAGARLLARGQAGLAGTPIGARPHVARMLAEAAATAQARLGPERAVASAAAGALLASGAAFALAQALLGPPTAGAVATAEPRAA